MEFLCKILVENIDLQIEDESKFMIKNISVNPWPNQKSKFQNLI